MALVVNSNISSLNAQRQLASSGAEMNKTAERLASGKRINSAADDAAGLAISNRQTSQIRGLDQAIRNANDGISLIQTAEGAMQETTNILQRMRELAVQSSNGIYSDSDRATLNAEVQQLKEEIDRIADTTSFNGKKILDGSLGEIALQIGASSNQTIKLSVDTMSTSKLGGSAGGDIVGTSISDTDLSDGLDVDGDITINGQTVTAASLTTGPTNMNAVLDVLNKSVSGVEFTASTRFEAASAGTGVLRGDDTIEITLANADGTATSLQVGNTGNMNELVDAINKVGGTELSASLTDDGKLVLDSKSGAAITVAAAAVTEQSAVGLTGTTITKSAQISMTSTDGKPITVGYATATDAGVLGINARTDTGDVTGSAAVADGAVNLLEGQIKINGVDIGAADGTDVADVVAAINAKSNETGVVASGDNNTVLSLNSVNGKEISIELGKTAGAATTLTTMNLLETNTSKTSGDSLSDIDISTAAGAQKALDVIDKSLEQVNNTRSSLGAINNRLDFTVSNLSNVVEKTEASRSRIVDADFAKETAALSRSQVLQQASQAMLAQANARPQQVLQLLG